MTVVVAAVAAVLVLTPARWLWARPDVPWFVPYLVWAALIAAAWWAARGAHRGR